jgi:hypothetical protein
MSPQARTTLSLCRQVVASERADSDRGDGWLQTRSLGAVGPVRARVRSRTNSGHHDPDGTHEPKRFRM